MRLAKMVVFVAITTLLIGVGYFYVKYDFPSSHHQVQIVGQPIDHLNGVVVYYNGNVSHVSGRNTTVDGYNLGLRYQCVEFVKRYYYEHLRHEMPDSYGHAKDFFDQQLADGERNPARDLIQYRNPSQVKPQVNDLVIFDGTPVNPYGHVAIISAVGDRHIEIIQQNPGPRGRSRVTLPLHNEQRAWRIKSAKLLGWLRKTA